MAEQVGAPAAARLRPAPRPRVAPEAREEGCDYCEECGRLLSGRGAVYCADCQRDIRLYTADRARVLQATGAKVAEIADRLGISEAEARGALALAARVRRHKQRVMRAR